jgi:hypothetical protein
MKTLVITPKDEKDFEFLSELLEKLGFETQVFYDEDKEDMDLLKAMIEEKKGDYVTEDEVMKTLKKR